VQVVTCLFLRCTILAATQRSNDLATFGDKLTPELVVRLADIVFRTLSIFLAKILVPDGQYHRLAEAGEILQLVEFSRLVPEDVAI